MAATAATSGPPAHRYTSMLAEKELAKFHHTFSTFDRDGGGDVDINELGVMFRQLGHRPSDAEMREMIYAVDADSSGTIDFEEFCLLQLRVKRSANTPKWLRLALAGDDDGEAPAEDGPPDEADLSAGGGSPLKNEERLLVVADLLPNSRHLLSLNLSGYGERLGVFVAEELARALERCNRTLLALALSHNNIGDAGAVAMARALTNGVLTSVDLSHNGIGSAGADAILNALDGAAPPGTDRTEKRRCALRSLALEGNGEISSSVLGAISSSILRLDLPRRVREQQAARAAADERAATAAAEAEEAAAASLLCALEAGAPPVAGGGDGVALRVADPWLSLAHAPVLGQEVDRSGASALHVQGCPRFVDDGAVALLEGARRGAPPPPPRGVPPPPPPPSRRCTCCGCRTAPWATRGW